MIEGVVRGYWYFINNFINLIFYRGEVKALCFLLSNNTVRLSKWSPPVLEFFDTISVVCGTVINHKTINPLCSFRLLVSTPLVRSSFTPYYRQTRFFVLSIVRLIFFFFFLCTIVNLFFRFSIDIRTLDPTNKSTLIRFWLSQILFD